MNLMYPFEVAEEGKDVNPQNIRLAIIISLANSSDAQLLDRIRVIDPLTTKKEESKDEAHSSTSSESSNNDGSTESIS